MQRPGNHVATLQPVNTSLNANSNGGENMSTSPHTLTAMDVDSNDKSQKLFQIKREKDDGSGNTVSVSGSKGSHGNRILKGLLNQNDEDESEFNEETCTDNNRPSAANRLLPTVLSQPVASAAASEVGGGKNAGNVSCGNANGNNNMLHKLLNVRSDDDAEERMGLRKPNELLKKLLKDSDEESQQIGASGSGGNGSGASSSNHLYLSNQIDLNQESFQSQEEQLLLKSLGFPSPSSTPSSASSVSALHAHNPCQSSTTSVSLASVGQAGSNVTQSPSVHLKSPIGKLQLVLFLFLK